ncbi:LamG domain-containing protein [bacterium]|nr:LamG domain-containing protein [bacterium]
MPEQQKELKKVLRQEHTPQMIGYNGILNNNYNLRIGNSGSSWTYFFRGTVDDVKIYNRALSGQEVKKHYQSR